MSRTKILRGMGIAVVSVMLLLSAAQDLRRAADRAEAAQPPGPRVTSDTQLLSIDHIHALTRRSLEAVFPGRYVLDVDKDRMEMTVTVWTPGLNARALNEATRSRLALEKWQANLRTHAELCADLQRRCGEHGHPELSVIFRCVNCDDLTQPFSVVERGELVYDIVDATPAGEPITQRVLAEPDGELRRYVVNLSSKVFHLPGCDAGESMSAENRHDYTGARADLIDAGYRPCGRCNP